MRRQPGRQGRVLFLVCKGREQGVGLDWERGFAAHLFDELSSAGGQQDGSKGGQECDVGAQPAAYALETLQGGSLSVTRDAGHTLQENKTKQ